MKPVIGRRIFIIDHDPAWAAMLTKMLKDFGYANIVNFSLGSDCIKNLDLNPDLIFLDYQLKDMDGLKLLQKIKSHNKDIIVIFCTEHKKLSVAVNAMKNGSFEYFLKSGFTAKQLAAIIKNLEEMSVFTESIF